VNGWSSRWIAEASYTALVIRFLGLVLSALASCGPSGGYGTAAAGVGVAVAATGLYRGVTGDCWAACSAGYVCDRARGVCVAGECLSVGCAPGSRCAIEPDGHFDCVADLTVIPLSRRSAVNIYEAGAPPTGAPDAGED
jgi:hypothetical protein